VVEHFSTVDERRRTASVEVHGADQAQVLHELRRNRERDAGSTAGYGAADRH
jgi:hypothetical protein